MERWSVFLFGLLLVCVANGDDEAGFISIDCGIHDGYQYSDNTTTLNYVSDASFINGAGTPRTILPIYRSKYLDTQFLTVRSFSQGTRNCYALKPAQGKGNRYLIRARFLYGNYDSTDQKPLFELHLGADKWDTINITDSDVPINKEIIHVPLSDYIYVCLVNIGLGTPFISALELRLLNTSMYATEYGSLITASRINFGSIYDTVRYKDDKYDRLWLRTSWANSTSIWTFETVTSGFATTLELPTKVMSDAIKPRPPTDSLHFPWDPRNATDQFFIYMHIAEIEMLKPNQTREFNIYLNDKLWLPRPFSPFNLTSTTIYSTEPENISSSYVLTLNRTQKSTLPPIINALEIYKVRRLLQWQTDDNDAEAIWSIKSVYNITEDWQGDPCTPQAFSWNALNCSYNGFNPPRIISLNLSSRRLKGQITHNLGNLSMLQILDLSNNDLTGPIPDFLSQLTFLKGLNLRGNNFTGSVPAELLAKSNNKSLSLSVDERNIGGITSTCLDDSCKSKKQSRFIIPVAASVASVSMVLFGLVIIWLIRNKKTQGGKRLVELKNRQFTYSEVLRITNNFHKVIGKGGFGTVYHGYVSDIEVAVKMLSPSSIQGYKEFQAEANLLTSVHHKNLTSLVGYCNEGSNIAIIYEYMANGSLDRHLSATSPNPLTWEERLQTALDAGQGLEYLHHGCKQPIVHRDVKCTNILLNEKFQAKLSDFGLSRAFPVEGGTHVSTVIAGTPGYLDPEYYTSNRLTEKSDVYSYGVVLLEIITSRPAITASGDQEDANHVSQWVSSMFAEGDVKSIVDPRLQGDFDIESVRKAVKLAMACVDRTSSKRPTMNDVVIELKTCLASERARTRAQHETEAADSLGSVTLNWTL